MNLLKILQLDRSLIFIGLTLLTIFSCHKNSIFPKELTSCDKIYSSEDLEQVVDFKQNFSIDIPKHWNTKMYYDNFRSEIFSADTIKPISETYILQVSHIQSAIQINDTLVKSLNKKSSDHHRTEELVKFHQFKDREALIFVSSGMENNLPLYILQDYVKIDQDQYLLMKVDIYGSENIEERLCEALQLLEKVSIFEN